MENKEPDRNEIKPESEGETIRQSGLAYAAALTLFAAVVIMLAAGWLVDNYFESSPWGIVGGVVLGSILGLYQFVRITSQISRDE